jgi:aryl-alcohol dehydrogenase-like predicted oxidoreductase
VGVGDDALCDSVKTAAQPLNILGGRGRTAEASLTRLGTNYLDLYLLHWPVSNDHFSDAVAGFERLRAASKIRSWGARRIAANIAKLPELQS